MTEMESRGFTDEEALSSSQEANALTKKRQEEWSDWALKVLSSLRIPMVRLILACGTTAIANMMALAHLYQSQL